MAAPNQLLAVSVPRIQAMCQWQLRLRWQFLHRTGRPHKTVRALWLAEQAAFPQTGQDNMSMLFFIMIVSLCKPVAALTEATCLL